MVGTWPSVRPVDILDIVVVAVVIYWILLFIRGTRAVQILFGLLVVLGILGLSKRLGMITFQWVVGNALGYVIVILAIIFQSEIRRGLAKMGQARIFGRTAPRPAPGFLNELARSVFLLARSRTGAILVLERTMRLVELVEPGKQIDALFSHELLASILSPSSPLHDGAVVFRAERIATAGVFLPFPAESLAARAMGSRHRAAWGAAVDTDAVIIVVSEETGGVTVFHDRTSEPAETEGALCAILGILSRDVGEPDA
jgi:diadenylate cyclase